MEQYPWQFDSPPLPPPPDLEQSPLEEVEDSEEVKRNVQTRQSTYDYAEVLQKSMLFYEAQRSGKLPANHRISWRGDSGLYDKGENDEDLTGGYYDAGDHVKFGLPMAYTITVLTWGLIRYEDAYKAAGELDNMYDAVKWGTDYFIKAHPSPNVFYAQVGSGAIDHKYWVRPEDMTMPRPTTKLDSSNCGSDIAAETAAALAAVSTAFKKRDPAYSAECLKHAEELFTFADECRGLFNGKYYHSDKYGDELAWAAAWLYRATSTNAWKNKAAQLWNKYACNGIPYSFGWSTKNVGVSLLMFELTGEKEYAKRVKPYVNAWLPENGFDTTPKGLAFRSKWGPLRYAAGTAMIALIASELGLRTPKYKEFATQQIHYMLGDGGRSYVVGFGENFPKSPHHRASSCSDTICGNAALNSADPNPNVLVGALVGGPGEYDNYNDNRKDYVKNEVACDYNAAFQTAVAALLHMELTPPTL
uniref:Endoglucanase n=1 Tax=Saccoglossus kowalevskii TaxID=10224 RepID=A0ABM0MAT3_SACKO|nr:PREDICTED: endoglucanase 19-like [Saccoglossus kowalevskii]